jgi:hypothetical protein
MAKRKTSSPAQKAKYAAYEMESKRLKSKAYDLAKHLEYNPTDKIAIKAYSLIDQIFKNKAEARLARNKLIKEEPELALFGD